MGFAQVQEGQIANNAVHLRHLAEDIPLGALPPLEAAFAWTDLSAPFLVGEIGAARHIHTILCEIITAFDAGILLTIGDTDAHGRLMASAEIATQIALTYEGQPHYAYAESTDLYLYLEAGTPTHGAGVITVYYQ